MNIEEIKKFLAENKDNEEVKAFVGELSAVSADKVEGFLETEEGKRFIQPRLDSYFTKGLATWKANNLDSIVEEKIRERNPDKTPAELEIEKLKKQIEDAEKARNREALVNKALNVADEKSCLKELLTILLAKTRKQHLPILVSLKRHSMQQFKML